MRNEKDKSWQGTQQMRKGPSQNITADSSKESSGDDNCEENGNTNTVLLKYLHGSRIIDENEEQLIGAFSSPTADRL